MKPKITCRGGSGLLCLVCMTAALAGCAEFEDDPNKPRPMRAVESPVGSASANSELMGPAVSAVPLVTVELPNRRNQEPQVHTIMEPLMALAQAGPAAPATQAATRPATQPATAPASAPAEPLVPPTVILTDAPMRVVPKAKAADTVSATAEGEKVLVSVVSESGIGSAVLERTGEQWPASISVRFTHGARPFTRLEGFNAAELTEGGARVALRVEVNRDAATATISIPQFVRSTRISIEWVDMYR